MANIDVACTNPWTATRSKVADPSDISTNHYAPASFAGSGEGAAECIYATAARAA